MAEVLDLTLAAAAAREDSGRTSAVRLLFLRAVPRIRLSLAGVVLLLVQVREEVARLRRLLPFHLPVAVEEDATKQALRFLADLEAAVEPMLFPVLLQTERLETRQAPVQARETMAGLGHGFLAGMPAAEEAAPVPLVGMAFPALPVALVEMVRQARFLASARRMPAAAAARTEIRRLEHVPRAAQVVRVVEAGGPGTRWQALPARQIPAVAAEVGHLRRMERYSL